MAMPLLSNDDYEVLEDRIPPTILEFDCVGSIVVRAEGGDDRGAQGNPGGAPTNAMNTVTPITAFEIEGGEIKSSATDKSLRLIS